MQIWQAQHLLMHTVLDLLLDKLYEISWVPTNQIVVVMCGKCVMLCHSQSQATFTDLVGDYYNEQNTNSILQNVQMGLCKIFKSSALFFILQ